MNQTRLQPYLPADRRVALARGETLPELGHGAVLFVDVSGFTALSEALARTLGPDRGAEMIMQQLNVVYDRLIKLVDRRAGSVVSFSGDAMTCWFGELASGARREGSGETVANQVPTPQPSSPAACAVACALAMLDELAKHAPIRVVGHGEIVLAIKAAIAYGPVQRILVGDPAVQRFDVLAGATMLRLAAAEQLARPGELILDEVTTTALGGLLSVQAWRSSPTTETRFAVAGPLLQSVPLPQAESSASDPISRFERFDFRPWLLPQVYEQVVNGREPLLAELRAVTALFLRFQGLDFERDNAASTCIDTFIRMVQVTLARYGGTLLQVTVGDKGQYCYAVFGAPAAHEDDPDRAVAAARDLHALTAQFNWLTALQIGLSSGMTWVGAYGGSTRRTYGVLGDNVNLAARLMTQAVPGQTLVSQRIVDAARQHMFRFVGQVALKGKQQPVALYEAITPTAAKNIHKRAAVAMVGRQAEQALLAEQLGLLASRQRDVAFGAGMIVIEGDPGVGKSLLVEHAREVAQTCGVRALAGGGDALQQHVPYVAWRSVFWHLFGLDNLPDDRAVQQAHVLDWLRFDAGAFERAPLLNSVLPLMFVDTPVTAQLSGELQAENTHNLFALVLDRFARTQPTLLVLEDAHWLDAASWRVLRLVQRRVSGLLVLLATRPFEQKPPPAARYLLQLPDTTHLPLGALSAAETLALVSRRLDVATLPDVLAALILEKAQGNPFWSEELALALRDNAVIEIVDGVCRLRQALGSGEVLPFVPDSVESVIASRIDRLAPAHQATLKVASVIGRVFAQRTLHDVHPILEERPAIAAHLAALDQARVVQLHMPAADEYMFTHALTHNVAYRKLLFAQRRDLHRAVAEWHEHTFGADDGRLASFAAVLAHHWEQAEVADKAIDYLQRAGEQTQQLYANDEAIRFFRRALALLERAYQDRTLVGSAPGTQSNNQNSAPWVVQQLIEIRRKLGEVLFLVGEWREAESMFRQALVLALQFGDARAQAHCQTALGHLLSFSKSFAEAAQSLEQAKSIFTRLGDQVGLARTLEHLGFNHKQQSQYDQAIACVEQQLQIAQTLGDAAGTSTALLTLGQVHWHRGALDQAIATLEHALELAEAAHDRRGTVQILNNLAGVYWQQQHYPQALHQVQAALSHAFAIGYRQMIGVMLGNAGDIYRLYGESANAAQCYLHGLQILAELGHRVGIHNNLGNLALLLVEQQEYEAAERVFRLAITIGRQLDVPRALCTKLANFAALLAEQGRLDQAHALNEEAREVAGRSRRVDLLLDIDLLAIRVAVLRGEQTTVSAIADLVALGQAWLELEEQAAIFEAIWRLDQSQHTARDQACDHYRVLYRQTAHAEYRQRYQALCGQQLPMPPALPALHLPSTLPPAELELVLAMIQAEYSKG